MPIYTNPYSNPGGGRPPLWHPVSELWMVVSADFYLINRRTKMSSRSETRSNEYTLRGSLPVLFAHAM